jgi:hypothetical protein
VVASLTARQIELEVTRGNNTVGTCQSQGVEAEDPLKSERMKRMARRRNSTELVRKSLALSDEGQ